MTWIGKRFCHRKNKTWKSFSPIGCAIKNYNFKDLWQFDICLGIMVVWQPVLWPLCFAKIAWHPLCQDHSSATTLWRLLCDNHCVATVWQPQCDDRYVTNCVATVWHPLCHCQNLYVTTTTRPLCDNRLVWQPVCGKIVLLWITEISPFWLDDYTRQDNKMVGLWGCAAGAQPKKNA